MVYVDRWIDTETACDMHAEEQIITTDELPYQEVLVSVDGDGNEKYESIKDTQHYHALYDRSRVQGHSYRPYKTGSELWRKFANQALSEEANANFRKDGY